jgi:hypothetical protein
MNNYFSMRANEEAAANHGAEDDSAPIPPEAAIALCRNAANLMQLWALCRHSGCYRTRACRGDSRECYRRYMPLVPEDAREWCIAAVIGQSEGRDFDAVVAENEEEFEALLDWYKVLEHSMRKAVKPEDPRA